MEEIIKQQTQNEFLHIVQHYVEKEDLTKKRLLDLATDLWEADRDSGLFAYLVFKETPTAEMYFSWLKEVVHLLMPEVSI